MKKKDVEAISKMTQENMDLKEIIVRLKIEGCQEKFYVEEDEDVKIKVSCEKAILKSYYKRNRCDHCKMIDDLLEKHGIVL